MTEREAAYNAKLQDLIGKVGNLTEAEVKRVQVLLERSRKEVGSRIAETEWQAHFLPQLQSAVKRAIEGYRLQYADLLQKALLNMWNAGIDQVDWPINYVGIGAHAPEISRSALDIMQGYSADLVTNVSKDLVGRINGELTLGILGGKTPFEVMKAIGRNLDDPSVFRSIAVRAETITRTEMARVNSAARQARMSAVVKADPGRGWLKKWISSGKFHPRPTHLALNGTTVSVTRDFPGHIPYPHAPGLPASEVINCG